MATDLAGCLARLARADECLADFNSACQIWVKEEADKLVHDYDPETRKYSVVCKKAPVAPPRLTIVLGDAIHSLRSCLDFLVYALAVHESQQEPPPNASRLAFPVVHTNEVEFDRRWAERLEHLSIEARAEIENLQPFREYPARASDWICSLLVLEKLNNVYKHRRLSVLAVLPGSELRLGANKDIAVAGIRAPGPLEDDAELITIITDGSPDIEVQYERTLDVAFNEPDVLAGWPDVREVLTPIRQDVEVVLHRVATLMNHSGELAIIWGMPSQLRE
jgi:hypothetical protein